MAEKFLTMIERRDYESGELKQTTRESTLKTEEPDFVKLYIKAWCIFKNIKGINSNFLYALLPYMTYAKNGQKIFLSPALKREVGESLGWSEKTVLNRFDQETKKLIKNKVLKRLKGGCIAVNPELIGKGNWAEIRALRATFNVETGEVSCEYDPEQNMFAM